VLLSAEAETIDSASLFEDLKERSHPPRYNLVSFFNPWGEKVMVHEDLPDNFGRWIVAAARTYAAQGIRFDGYMGSDDDGRHYASAADGKDVAFVGDRPSRSYLEKTNGVPDDMNERVWICLDLPIHSVTLAGYPLREAMFEDFHLVPGVYTLGGGFPENTPDTLHFFRRVRNLRTFFKRKQQYVELRVTKEQYRDASFRPETPFQSGDVVFFGHYGDPEGTGGRWHPKHSGIVAKVDERGLPVTVYNMRVSRDLIDFYDGEINQTRSIEGKDVLFERFSDRYSLIGFGRIINPFQPVKSGNQERE
jgi:uncharacterized protein YijF (DUF1287 family)